MYIIALIAHSLLRWVVVLAAIYVIARAFSGWFGKREWTAADNQAGMLFVNTLNIQFVLGIVLYFFLSPVTTRALQGFGAAMANPVARFWLVEHITVMLIALAIAHIGRARARRANNPARKHRLAAIFYTLSIILILISIPWPFMQVSRPLFRFG